MSSPLIRSKLIPPRPRRGLVLRPRLENLLARSADSSVTLLAAPAGFGKTTVLSSWLSSDASTRATAWLALDERDRHLESFWTYVLLALDEAVPGVGATVLERLPAHPAEAVITDLLNEVSVLPSDLTLVLDDYHLAESPEVGSSMSFLVRHLPPQLHVIVSTRTDPTLPLARLRASGDLVEIRAADLRFTAQEALDYFGAQGLELSRDQVATLEARTEGWAAALQLSALSLEGRPEPGEFIDGFAGTDRFVVDYLADEVLGRQSENVRTFLLETSILGRLSAPLCDAVTHHGDGRAMLDELERQNLFLIPLDDERGWYRYHHLFADVLRAHLAAERPSDLSVLHRRASDWHDAQGNLEDALEHAKAAGDLERVADLIELAAPELRRQRQEAVIRRWIESLPDDLVQRRPVLAVDLIGALAAGNEFGGLDDRLRRVDQMLTRPREEVDAHNISELDRLPAVVETYRAALALVGGDPAGTVAHAARAAGKAADDDSLTIAAASALEGLADWTRGELAKALDCYQRASTHLERAGHVADVLGCTIAVADLQLAQGQLRSAEQAFRQSLALAAQERGPTVAVRGTADMYVGLSRVAWEAGDLEGAAAHLAAAMELGEPAELLQNAYRWRRALARLRESDGDFDGAVGLLEEAEDAYIGDFLPNVSPVAATRARVLARAGDLDRAMEWARLHDVAADDELSYLREYEHITLAQILVTERALTGNDAALKQAVALLDRLLAAARAGGRIYSAIEILVLQSAVLTGVGDTEEARLRIESATALAEPRGFVSVLTVAPTSWRESDADTTSRPSPRPETPSSGTPLVDPLSSREVDVLRLLASDLDGPAIARELSVSLSTVRTHTQHIYTKLGVNNRRTAVRRAHQLNLFTQR